MEHNEWNDPYWMNDRMALLMAHCMNDRMALINGSFHECPNGSINGSVMAQMNGHSFLLLSIMAFFFV